ncbi:MAG: hypothetical protein CEE38_23500, partial [Planctomycetes bacterium B3_Pla]
MKLIQDSEEHDQEESDREIITQVNNHAIEACRQEEITQGKILELGEILRVSGRGLVAHAEAAKSG